MNPLNNASDEQERYLLFIPGRFPIEATIIHLNHSNRFWHLTTMSSLKPSSPIIRPKTVTILAVFWGMLGCILLTIGLLSVIGVVRFHAGAASDTTIPDVNSPLGAAIALLAGSFFLTIFGILSILVSLPAIGACLGLMQMRRKGLLNSNSVSGLLLLGNFMTLPFTWGSRTAIFSTVIAAIALFSLVYLNRKSVRRQFS
jgi:putative exporter of polyketide antibiotics